MTEAPTVEVAERDSASRQAAAIARHRRKVRRLWFVVGETVALAVTILTVIAGISERFAAESLTPIFRLVPITTAVIAAILPILFFGDPKRGTRRE